MLTDFQNSFAYRLNCKFATKSYLNILPHHKYVATLPCEIPTLENWQQSEYSKHLSCDGLLRYKFISQFAGEKFLKTGKDFAELQAKRLIMSYATFALDFCPQRCRTRWISKITCVLRTETGTDCCHVNRQINAS